MKVTLLVFVIGLSISLNALANKNNLLIDDIFTPDSEELKLLQIDSNFRSFPENKIEIKVKEPKKNFMDSFNRIISSESQYFASCYKQSLSSGVTIKGNIQFRMTFMPNGKIDMIGVVENTNYQNRDLVRCIYSKLLKLDFPGTAKSKNMVIAKQFNF